MFHGGTSFRFIAGANEYENYAPTVTGYDYWSALDEAGRPTAKFFAYRELLAEHQLPGSSPLPDLREPLPHNVFPDIELTEIALLFDNLPEPIESVTTKTMEEIGQLHGLVLYRTDVAGRGKGDFGIVEPHDYAIVYLNHQQILTLNRRHKQDTVKLDHIPDDNAVLDVLVGTTGRVNFGPNLADRKGITSHVELDLPPRIIPFSIRVIPC